MESVLVSFAELDAHLKNLQQKSSVVIVHHFRSIRVGMMKTEVKSMVAQLLVVQRRQSLLLTKNLEWETQLVVLVRTPTFKRLRPGYKKNRKSCTSILSM